MELINQTPLGARFWRSTLVAEGRMLGVVAIKGTYSMPGGALDVDAPHTILNNDQETELGVIPKDLVPWKTGVDVFVLGKAHAPARRPVQSVQCSVRVGQFERTFHVVGDRVWQRNGRDIVASQPEPFVEMPVTWERAFGGAARVAESGTVPHPYNPLGKGFVLEEDHAEGVPLPNVEDPSAPLRAWFETPVPSLPAPLASGSPFYADDMLDCPRNTQVLSVEDVKWKGISFNAAHPHMRHPGIRPGDAVTLQGWNAAGALQFKLPKDAFEVEVLLDTRHYRFPARLDTVCILPEEQRFFVVHRCHFTYSLRGGETRLARVSSVLG